MSKATPMFPTHLAEMAVGQSARIARVEGTGAIQQRLLDMGITRGTVVLVKRVAPLGDPLEISVKGYALAMRRCEAQAVLVEPEGT